MQLLAISPSYNVTPVTLNLKSANEVHIPALEDTKECWDALSETDKCLFILFLLFFFGLSYSLRKPPPGPPSGLVIAFPLKTKEANTVNQGFRVHGALCKFICLTSLKVL